MSRPVAIAFAMYVLVVGFVVAQDGIRKGALKKLDAEKKTVTITVDGKDQDFVLTENTRVPGTEGKEFKDRFAGLKPGSEIQFKTETKDGREVVIGMRPFPAGGQQPKFEKVDSSKLKPLTELGTEKYQGYEGGLYPGGKNDRPKDHEAAGLAIAKQVQPLDAAGMPAAGGKAVLLSVGMSNTTQEFSAFKRLADADPEKNPDLLIVDGAQGGMTAARIKDPGDNGPGAKFWEVVDQRLKAAGATREQVQIAWIKEADAGPTQGFPKYAQTLRDELRQIVRMMRMRFPNLKLVYLSSRIYAGFARTPLNPEPYAYESGFSVRWLIDEQLKGDADLNFDPKRGAVKAPWLSWGPYLWANGGTKNPGGLAYDEADFAPDGTHPSAAGQKKVAEQLLKFFKTDSTAQVWLTRGGR
jgi:hypothetical protein